MPTNNSFYESIQIATMGLEEVKNVLIEVQQIAIQTSQAVRESIDSSTGTTPADATANIKKTTTAVNEFGVVVTKTNDKIQAMVELHKQRMEAEEKANQTTSRGKKIVNEFNQVTIKTNKHIQAAVSLNKQREKTIEANTKATAKENAESKKRASQYLRMNKHFQYLKATYRDLAIQKELGIDLTENETARMNALKDKILVLDKAYKQVDGSMGVYNRSVGQYGRAFDSLGFSVAQITREAPAFLNSVQTGFMAISNNIPVFVDELEKLKIKNAELVADRKKAIPIWKSVTKAIFSYQTAISVGILGLTYFAPKIFEYIKAMGRAADITGRASERIKEMNEATDEVAVKLPLLVQAIQDQNTSEARRLQLIGQLKQEYPGFNSQLLEEAENTALVTEEIEKYIEQASLKEQANQDIKDLVQLRIQEREATRKLNEISDHEIELLKQKIQLFHQGKISIQSLTGRERDYIDATEDMIRIEAAKKNISEDYLDVLKDINEEEEERIENTQKIYGQGTIGYYRQVISVLEETKNNLNANDTVAIQTINNHIDRIKKLIEEQKIEETFLEGSIGWLNQQIAKNKELIEQSNDRTFIMKTQEENEKLEEQIKLLEEGKELRTPIKAQTADTSIIGNLEKQISLTNKLQKMASSQEEINHLENVKMKLQENLEVVKAGGQARVDYNDEINAQMQEYLRNLDIQEAREKEKAIGEQKWMEQKIEKLQMINDFIQQGADLGIALIERNVVALEKEMNAVQEKYENDVALAEKTFVDEEELQNKKDALEEERVIREKEIEKKIAKEKKKQFLVNQAAALAEIAINTAIWVTNAGAQTGLFGLTLAPFIIAFGALQAATVLAQPVPAYKDGIESHPGGLAVLGDGGKHEAAILPTGQVWKTPKSDTLVDLPAGTRVEPDFDKYIEGESKAVYDTNLLRTIAIREIKERQNKELLMAINRQTEVLKKKNLSVNVKGQRDLNHQLWRMKQINWS